MEITRKEQIETVYVKGTHEDFQAALSDAMAAAFEKNEGSVGSSVQQISHSIAVDGDGAIHWSGVVRVMFTFEDEGEE